MRANRFTGKFKVESGNVCACFALSGDGSTLVAGPFADRGEGNVVVWSVKEGKARFVLKGHKGPVFAVAVAPDGKTLATGGGNPVRALAAPQLIVWDISTGKKAKSLVGFSSAIWALGFSPDGKLLASGISAGSVLVWETSSWKRLGTMAAKKDEGIVALQFSKDGKRLVAGTSAGRVLEWKVDEAHKEK